MKQVEKLWAELSAKSQEASKEVENTQEVELSEEQKVELASLADFAKYERELKQILSEVDATTGKYDKLRNELRSIKSEFGQAQDNAAKADNLRKQAQNEMNKAATEMGLDARPIAQAAAQSVDLYSKILRKTERGIREIGRA